MSEIRRTPPWRLLEVTRHRAIGERLRMLGYGKEARYASSRGTSVPLALSFEHG